MAGQDDYRKGHRGSREVPTCAIAWQGATPLQAMVYDQDFVARNFSDSAEIRGIFTLGESTIATIEQIAEARKFIFDQSDRLAGLRRARAGEDGTGGKQAELAQLDHELGQVLGPEDQVRLRLCWCVRRLPKQQGELQGQDPAGARPTL